MFRKLGKRAQTTAEYAILIALVVGAVVAMQVYVKRGIQGRVKEVVDHTGVGGEVAGKNLTLSGKGYEPYYLQSTASTSQQTGSTESLLTGGATSTSSTTSVTADRDATVGWYGSEE